MIAPIGVRAVGAGRAATPPSPCLSKFCATQIFGAARKIWANQIFTTVSMFRFGNGIALINFERAYANSVVSNGSYHGYLGSSKWQRQLYLSFNVCYRKEYIHFVCRPMLVYRMTPVPLRLFHKNLGNLQVFFRASGSLLPPASNKWPLGPYGHP